MQLGRWGKNQGNWRPSSQAMYHARELAMTRMEAEAAALGADGIVGVRLTVEAREFGKDVAEFIAIGTAVKADNPPPGGGSWRNNKQQPFTSDLSGQDFWTLIQAGYAPCGMVMGTCVYHIAHQRMGAVFSNMGRNVEIEQFTYRPCMTPVSWRWRACRRKRSRCMRKAWSACSSTRTITAGAGTPPNSSRSGRRSGRCGRTTRSSGPRWHAEPRRG